MRQRSETSDNLTGEIKECIEEWECGEWNECDNRTQTRTCEELNNCNTSKNKPEIEKECCSWECGEWTACLPTNISFRTCTIPEECKSIVKVEIYLKDINDFKEVNKFYTKIFSKPYPARHVVEVSNLPLNVKIEIACIACKD